MDEDDLVEHILVNIVDEGLKKCRGFSETKKHNKVLEMSKGVLNAFFHSSATHGSQEFLHLLMALSFNGQVERMKMSPAQRGSPVGEELLVSQTISFSITLILFAN